MFEDFATEHLGVGEASLLVRHAGSGSPILLVHGHPRTSATWHAVAPRLVERGYTVVCPDLRGYGASIGPEPSADHRAHSKRAMARDLVAVMGQLGHARFAVAGHDRGSYVALRLGLDHPELVSRLVLMNCLPISEHLARITPEFATQWWHWFFFAQPDRPERAIMADPHAWYAPSSDPASMGAENHRELMDAVARPSVVTSMLEDYRAGLTVDRDDEERDRAAGRRLTMPTLLLWSDRDGFEELHGDPVAIWRDWADHIRTGTIDSGHHMAEERPQEVADAIAEFVRG